MQGTFVGQSNRITTVGGVPIVHTAKGAIAVLESNFSRDRVPAPMLRFCWNGKFDKAGCSFGPASKDGLQSYALPASIDPPNSDGIAIWCTNFFVTLGSAKLNCSIAPNRNCLYHLPSDTDCIRGAACKARCLDHQSAAKHMNRPAPPVFFRAS